jgi:hypothetical protein
MWKILERILGRRDEDSEPFVAVYHVGGRFFIPALSRTRDGIYIECERVEILDAPTADALAAALHRAREREIRGIPTPPRDGYPPPVVQRHAGIGSHREFERVARHWTMECTTDGVAMIPSTRAAGGGFAHQPERTERFSGPDAVLRMAERLLEITR